MAEINGKRIRELRLELEIEQEDLARELGVSRQAIHAYESGKRNPEMSKLKTLTQILNCSADYLLDISDNRQYTIDDDDRAVFDEAMKKHGAEHQKRAFAMFAKILDSTADYHTSPYKDGLFSKTMLVLESRADHNEYAKLVIEGLEKDTDMTADKKAEIDMHLNILGETALEREREANNIIRASIASYFPSAYAISKQLFGVRDSGFSLDEATEILVEQGVIKPSKWSEHSGKKKK
jgi:transcriptional regulator with XRE-family HTH domain